jgi:hypothetical protein
MKRNSDFILEVYKDKRTVFTFNDLGLLLGESDKDKLKQKVNYYVRNKMILNIRKGIYAKENYNPEELACKIFTPAYLSLEYVLQKAGVIFQYSGKFTLVSYLSRNIKAGNHIFDYRRIKELVLINTAGINRLPADINIASPERAFLDILYLDKEFYLDNPEALDRKKIITILPAYNSKVMNERVRKFISK